MVDYSRTISGGGASDEKILVPAWDKAALADLGDRAVGVIIDGAALDEESYDNKPAAFRRPGMFSGGPGRAGGGD